MKNIFKIIIVLILSSCCLLLSACDDTNLPIKQDIISNENNTTEIQPNDEVLDNNEPIVSGVDKNQNDYQSTSTTDNNSKYIQVKVNGLNVRTGAGTQFSSICTFNSGDLLGYYGIEDGWYKTMVRGKIGYVSANEKYTKVLFMKKSNEDVENIINVALKYLGTPYVYGAIRYHNGNGVLLNGFTTEAFDCSSYMQYAFFIGNGKLLGLTTRNQVLQGKSVAKGNIQRGDLLFFTNSSRYYNTGIDRVGHVALYLGDNYILHTASDYAVIEQISATRWNYYLEARRMV